MSQQELLNQLAATLPQLINHLTPYGRMPTPADLEKDDAAPNAGRDLRILTPKAAEAVQRGGPAISKTSQPCLAGVGF